MTFPTEQYNHDQQNYIFDLREQAIKAKDISPTIGVSAFMIGAYFRLGYDVRFRQYWDGERHKPQWEGLGKRVDVLPSKELTDVVKQ